MLLATLTSESRRQKTVITNAVWLNDVIVKQEEEMSIVSVCFFHLSHKESAL